MLFRRELLVHTSGSYWDTCVEDQGEIEVVKLWDELKNVRLADQAL